MKESLWRVNILRKYIIYNLLANMLELKQNDTIKTGKENKLKVCESVGALCF